MRAYIPFDDGSAIGYDGNVFTVHKKPVEIDADLSSLADGEAARAWRERRGEIVKTLEAAWWKLQQQRKRGETRKIYSDKGSS